VADAARFREVMGHFASGVAIVTCNGPDGPAGLTTSAVASVSLDPLLLLVCFDNGSRTLAAVRGARRFAVNVLRAGQEDLALVFATKRVAREKFEAVTHKVAHGVPVIDGALAWLACDLTETVHAGDHTIGIGAVTHLDAAPDGEPLIYYKGIYGGLVGRPPTPSPMPAARGTR
jgi:flavin reductase (DIM6/NTAB) family NADH-FMN oxidoreductase RutF